MTAATSRQVDRLARLRAAMAAPQGRVTVVNVPLANFLMVDGNGGPGSVPFRCALERLADLSAAIRLYLQEGDGDLFDPMPVEILWANEADDLWGEASGGPWTWTAMVAQPTHVSPELVAAVHERIAPRIGPEPACRVRLGSLREGLCIQTAHQGPVPDGHRVRALLEERARELGYETHGPRHEIYLADLRHREAQPLRIVVRQPIHRAS